MIFFICHPLKVIFIHYKSENCDSNLQLVHVVMDEEDLKMLKMDKTDVAVLSGVWVT